MFLGSVGCVPILEGKLEFHSHFALILVPHYIGYERLSSIYINSSHAHCYPCYTPHTRAHTPNRTRPLKVHLEGVNKCNANLMINDVKFKTNC